MEILGIGMPELIFIVIISLLILGPKDMQKAGRTIGRFLRSVVTSDGWKLFQQTSRDLRTLPNKLMRDANEELDKVNRDIRSAASIPDLNNSNPAGTRPQPQPFSTNKPPVKQQSGSDNSIAPAMHEAKEPESEPKNNA
jgi:Sec-independent protein translocase protein TatA